MKGAKTNSVIIAPFLLEIICLNVQLLSVNIARGNEKGQTTGWVDTTMLISTLELCPLLLGLCLCR